MAEIGTMRLARAAELAGVHPDTLAAMARAGEVPATKIGRAWVFSSRLLQEWIDAGGKRDPFSPALRAAVKKVGDFYRGGPDPDDVRPRIRRIKQQTPPWADRRHLRVMYQMAARVRRCTGLPYHLDHVFPLHGKRVSGLHLGANLRLLPAALNQRKHARFDDG